MDHPAFGYFAAIYSLQQVPITKLRGGPLDADIQLRQIDQLEQLWAGNQSRTIFIDRARARNSENKRENDSVDALANKLKYVRYSNLDALEDEPAPGAGNVPRDYPAAMRENMRQIKEGLQC